METGTLIVIVKILAKCLMTTSGFTGELADLIVSLTYILPAALIYKFSKNKVISSRFPFFILINNLLISARDTFPHTS